MPLAPNTPPSTPLISPTTVPNPAFIQHPCCNKTTQQCRRLSQPCAAAPKRSAATCASLYGRTRARLDRSSSAGAHHSGPPAATWPAPTAMSLTISQKPVPTEEMFRRIDKLGELGTAVVTISGGEPLAAPRTRRRNPSHPLQRHDRRINHERIFSGSGPNQAPEPCRTRVASDLHRQRQSR